MKDSADRKPPGQARLRLGAAAFWMFMVTAFVAPGVWSAILGLPQPVPGGTRSWGAWILLWLGVSGATYVISVGVFRLISRRGDRR